MLLQPGLHHPHCFEYMQRHHGPEQKRLNGPTEIREARDVFEQCIIVHGARFEVGAAAERDVSEQTRDEDYSHEAARWLIFLHRDVASPQTSDGLTVHGDHPWSGFWPGRHGRLDGYSMRSAGRCEDGQAVEVDVVQTRVPSGKAGELGVVPKVADQGVLMILVHVGDDPLLRCFVRALGCLLCHVRFVA